MQLLFLAIILLISIGRASQPITVEADSLERDKSGVITATGNVKIVYEGKILESEKVIYDTENKKITVPVKMFIKTQNIEGFGGSGWWDIENDEGEIYDFQGTIEKVYYVKGGTLRKTKDRYDFKDLEFSSCPFQQRDWYLKTSSGNAKENDKLRAFNVTLRFCKIPILYTPYFSYPLTDRKTGFLQPVIGQDTYNTFIYKQPFFYVINDYSDATFTVDYRNKQGYGLSTEYRRLLDEKSYITGQIDFFKDSKQEQIWKNRTNVPLEYRWRIKLDSNYSPLTGWNIYSKIDLPSDRYFFEDFYNMTPLRYTPFTRSYIVGRKEYDDFLVEFNFDYFYDLTQNNNRQTLQRLPEVRVYKKPSNVFSDNIYYDFLSDSTYFYREDGSSGIRTDNTLDIYNITNLKNFINIAEVMPRLTLYINTKNNNALDSRFLIPFRDTIQTNIIKPYDGFIHSIIPKVSFEYISKINQSSLPYYDVDDRVDEKKDIDVYLYNILNFKKDYYFRWEVSSGYTFLGAYKIGELNYLSNIKPLKNSILFQFKRLSADTTTYYDLNKNSIIRTITSLSLSPKTWLTFNTSYSYDSGLTNSKQFSNSFSLNFENYKLNGYILSNLSGGYIQRKNLSLVWDRKCWNLTFGFYEDYNATTDKRYKNVFLIINIMGYGYKMPFIRN